MILCWICRDTSEELLIKPCICNNKVHSSCLDKWRQSSSNPHDYTQCRICQSMYNLRYTRLQIGLYITQNKIHLILGLILLNTSILTLSIYECIYIPDSVLLYTMIRYYLGFLMLAGIQLILMVYINYYNVKLFYILIIIQTLICLPLFPLFHYHITLLVLYKFIIHPTLTYRSTVIQL